MLSKFNRTEHQHYLTKLPKLRQHIDDIQTLYHPETFRQTLIEYISQAQQRIYLTALYIEHDEGGEAVLNALYRAKQKNPQLEINVLVDWHRAQRGRIGAVAQDTNADWYYRLAKSHADTTFPIYGVPVNTREALGVLHLKGFIVDDTVIYSGASLNNIYLHCQDKYRYDRYQIIRNKALADTMSSYIKQQIIPSTAVQRLDQEYRPKTMEIKNNIRQFRQQLRGLSYQFSDQNSSDSLAVTPLIGLGKKNSLNETIYHLINSAEAKVTLCTPYFNLPKPLIKSIFYLLRNQVAVEIIVGDKTASDFFIPETEPFKIISALPYLYEINLRRFLSKLQKFIDSGLLTVRLWKDRDNSYHLKGIWVDNKWQLLTGNNLNPRAWWLDLENAILIHDPKQELTQQREKEYHCICQHTNVVKHYDEIDSIHSYPVKVRKLIRRLRRIRIDRLISRIL